MGRDKVIIDWDGRGWTGDVSMPALVLSKINAPFLFGDIIDIRDIMEDQLPSLPYEEPQLPEEEYLSALGNLHSHIKAVITETK